MFASSTDWLRQLSEERREDAQLRLVTSNPPLPSEAEEREAIEYLYDAIGLKRPEVIRASSPSEMKVLHDNWFNNRFQTRVPPIVTSFKSQFENLVELSGNPGSSTYFSSDPFMVNGRISAVGLSRFSSRLFARPFQMISGEWHRGIDPPLPNSIVFIGVEWIKFLSDEDIAEEAGLDYLADIVPILANLFGYTIAPWSNMCMIYPRPTIFVDAMFRLHNDNDAAFYWDTDGIHHDEGFLWHGITVPPRIILHPDTITAQDIYNQSNAEVRRAMMNKFGLRRFLKDIKSKPVHKDKFGKLYKVGFDGREVHTFVLVENGTSEANGSRKEYILPVPNRMQTAHEAVAWTFNRTVEDYLPVERT